MRTFYVVTSYGRLGAHDVHRDTDLAVAARVAEAVARARLGPERGALGAPLRRLPVATGGRPTGELGWFEEGGKEVLATLRAEIVQGVD